MSELKDDVFSGKGMDRTEFSDAERAQVRQMFTELSEAWPYIEDSKILVQGAGILFKVIKVGGPVALAMAVTGAYLKSQGLI